MSQSAQGATLRNIIANNAVIEPRAQGQENWRYRFNASPGYQSAFFPAAEQSVHKFEIEEPATYQGSNQRSKLTGKEPIYGLHRYDNDYDDNQTNVRAMNMMAATQMTPGNGFKQIDSKIRKVPHNPLWWKDYIGSQNMRLTKNM